MYKVSIYNNGIETIINHPSLEYDSPHLSELKLTEGLSLVDSLSFVLMQNNQGYDKVFELTTKIKVLDLRDNTIRFTGRILDVEEKMNSEGLFCKEITCESALSFLNDTKQRTTIYDDLSVRNFLIEVLNDHNSKVKNEKKIQVGNIDIAERVNHKANYKTTLEEIMLVREKVGGDIMVRETNGAIYLDWLQKFAGNTVEVSLGKNMKEMVVGKDTTNIGTRIIPLGANNLTISSINSGLDYVEDVSTKEQYGVIEKTVEYRDIENAYVLKNACLKDLKKYTQPLYALEINALDLSYLTNIKAEQFEIGTDLHIINPIMRVDDVYKIVQLEVDLLKPYNPKLTIANFQAMLSNSIDKINKNKLENNGVYDNVQIGDQYGIKSIRDDKKVSIDINAKEGISIKNNNKKVLYLDTNGNIIANDATFNDVVSNNMISNNMIAQQMRTSNNSNYIVLHDQYIEFFHNNRNIMIIGYTPLNKEPEIRFRGGSGERENGFGVSYDGAISPLGDMEFNKNAYFYGKAYYNGSELATKKDLEELKNG